MRGRDEPEHAVLGANVQNGISVYKAGQLASVRSGSCVDRGASSQPTYRLPGWNGQVLQQPMVSHGPKEYLGDTLFDKQPPPACGMPDDVWWGAPSSSCRVPHRRSLTSSSRPHVTGWQKLLQGASEVQGERLDAPQLHEAEARVRGQYRDVAFQIPRIEFLPPCLS